MPFEYKVTINRLNPLVIISCKRKLLVSKIMFKNGVSVSNFIKNLFRKIFFQKMFENNYFFMAGIPETVGLLKRINQIEKN
jgi:hypothetical protein